MFNRIPVTIITGFLGAGKTTLLRHLLQTSNQKLAVMVNEFGSVGLDGDLIRSCGFCPEEEVEGRLVELNNGCLCCTVQEDFLPTMEKLLQKIDRIDGIVIETSGLALPKPLLKAIEWPEIRSKVFVNGVVTLVDSQALVHGSPVADPEAINKQRKDDEKIDHLTAIEDLFLDQLFSADIVLLSRSDLLPSSAIETVKEKISKDIRPGTSVISISNGQVEPSLILGIRPEIAPKVLPEHEHDHEHVRVFSSSIRLELDVDQAECEKFLKNLSAKFQILRLKGRIWFSDKNLPLQIQMVGPRLSTWFEAVPNSAWRPNDIGGLDLVILSLKEDSEEKIRQLIIQRFS